MKQLGERNVTKRKTARTFLHNFSSQTIEPTNLFSSLYISLVYIIIKQPQTHRWKCVIGGKKWNGIIPSKKKRRGKGENFLAIRVSRWTIEARYRSEEEKKGGNKGGFSEWSGAGIGVQPRPSWSGKLQSFLPDHSGLSGYFTDDFTRRSCRCATNRERFGFVRVKSINGRRG